MDYIRREPVRFWSALTAFIEAFIALLIVFGALTWTDVQVATVMGLVAAGGGLFQFFFVRSKVTPNG